MIPYNILHSTHLLCAIMALPISVQHDRLPPPHKRSNKTKANTKLVTLIVCSI